MFFGRSFLTRRKQICLRLVAVTFSFAVFLSVLLYIDGEIRSTVSPLSVMNAEEIILSTVNAVVDEVISEQEYTYYDLVNTDTENGAVTYVTVNSAAVNALKSVITVRAEKELKQYRNLKTTAQLGSVIDSALLSNRGPEISVYFDFYCTVNTDFSEKFASTGLNQTNHTLRLTVSTRYCLVIVNKEHYDTVSTDYIIAQSIIQGDVPNAYGRLYGVDSTDT